jgi:SAM-dependent methyltransferase
MKRELLIGCGPNRDKRLGNGPDWSGLLTLDSNPVHAPDVIWDLEQLPLPFEDDSFDEIHAYEVLEHTGSQGDWRFFFDQWSDFWRILKPGGMFYGTVPHWRSPWAWGDPSHKRLVMPEHQFVFLSQSEYAKQAGKTPMSDFRFYYKADFDLESCEWEGESYWFSLRAIKPSRIDLAETFW